MAATAEGRAALQYAVVCALTTQQQVSTTINGTTYTYKGKLGLASSWTTSALSTTEQQWVSGCVLSLVNLYGTAVSVSLRGGSLTLETDEAADFSAEEGAFWGNMFLGESSYASACNGVDQAERDAGTSLTLRECAEEDPSAPGVTPCGFTFAGLCTEACSSSSWYGGCADGIHATTSNVVTTYVEP